MSEAQVGRVRIIATEGEIAKLTPFVKKVTDLLGTRIDPLTLETRAREDMPIAYKDEDGKIVYARGQWSERRRRMLCAKDLFGDSQQLLLDKTLGHEFVHVLWSDWLGKWHRKQLLPVITGDPDNWSDLTIGSTYWGYQADPSEALACWGSAALFGWDKPAYSTVYKRKIQAANFAKTKAVLLATAP